MIAEVLKTGQIMIKSETECERNLLQGFVESNAIDSKEFTMCCHNKKCAFKIETNDNRYTENNP